MSSDVFAIYQIDNSEKNREYRCRSYEYQIQHGFMITADNYGTGYSGTASRGMGAEAIRKKMESMAASTMYRKSPGVLVAGGRCLIGCILSRLSGDKKTMRRSRNRKEAEKVKIP